jgi:hypothetical protein
MPSPRDALRGDLLAACVRAADRGLRRDAIAEEVQSVHRICQVAANTARARAAESQAAGRRAGYRPMQTLVADALGSLRGGLTP